MIGVFAVGFLLMLVPLISSGSFLKLMVAVATVGALLTLVWFGSARGTYVTIDENKNLYGTLFFFRGKLTPLSDVVSIDIRKTFMGAMNEVYMMYCKEDGTVAENGVVNKESLKKSGFKKLLEAIRSANPNIEIAKALLEK